MTPTEFLKTEANPDDIIAITCDNDWELKHLENLLEQYHQAKLKLLGIADVVKSLPDFELQFCNNCYQMTNHLDNKCQKCKSNVL